MGAARQIESVGYNIIEGHSLPQKEKYYDKNLYIDSRSAFCSHPVVLVRSCVGVRSDHQRLLDLGQSNIR